MLRRNTAIFTNVIRELGLQNDEVEIKTKAYEIQKEVERKIDSKLITHWPSCKPALCIHVACETLRIPFDKRSIVKLASTTEQNYYSSLSYVKKTLNISNLSFDLLATRFGCPKTLQYLESMFEIFKNNWTKDLTNANIKAIDWNDDVFKVAIFWCVCKAFKDLQNRITLQELIDLPEVTITRAESNKYTRLVEKYCKSYIDELRSQKKAGVRLALKKPVPLKKRSKPKGNEGKTNDNSKETRRGRKRKLQDEETESNNIQHESQHEDDSKSVDKGIEPEEEEISCIGPSSSQGEMKIINYWETQLYIDYLDWREKIMQKISKRMD
ncbi:hypothetical protein RclHR1_07910006 [Rhizophagus clarus]|uniref:Origin of replication complex subunit 6 n=1 Tax=Rhizophagus clarus TaxID=94130 RepID=A0A2Z6SM55_9GLOM|nr:hypothetical protein RclHR1_07910006 [Rhizophagus clarus]GES74821.1 origin of replication complex subunit 6 [Rhizophagus clarus]